MAKSQPDGPKTATLRPQVQASLDRRWAGIVRALRFLKDE
jgi:hypothetical protein